METSQSELESTKEHENLRQLWCLFTSNNVKGFQDLYTLLPQIKIKELFVSTASLCMVDAFTPSSKPITRTPW